MRAAGGNRSRSPTTQTVPDAYRRLVTWVFGEDAETEDQRAVRLWLQARSSRRHQERQRLRAVDKAVIWPFWEAGYVARIRAAPLETGPGDALYRTLSRLSAR